MDDTDLNHLAEAPLRPAPAAEQLDPPEKRYLAYRAHKGGVLHIVADAAHMPQEIARTWFPEEPKWQAAVARLQKRFLDYILPVAGHAHAGARLALIANFTEKPPPISAPPHAVLALASMDAATGEARHEVGHAAQIGNHPAGQSVPLGLTFACRSIETAGDPLTVELSQGGNLYRLEGIELRENAAWKAEHDKSAGSGHPQFLGSPWHSPWLPDKKEAALGVAAAALLAEEEAPANSPQSANAANIGPILPGVAAIAATQALNGTQRSNEQFFDRPRKEESRRADAEFWKKKNEDDKRMQEQTRKNEETTAILAQSRKVEADRARLTAGPINMRNPELLAALREDEAVLAGMPGSTARSQIDIQMTDLDLADATRDAREHDNEVSIKAAAQTSRDSVEAASVASKNSAEAAAQSATAFVAPVIGTADVQTSFNEPSIAQGSVDYTGRIEPVGGPEDPGGGQARENGPPIMQGSVDYQGRVQPVAGAFRSDEIDNAAGSTNVEGEVEPVAGEQGVRWEEPDVDSESGIADSGEPLPNIPARPRSAETAREAAAESADTRFAEQAQAIVEDQQRRGEFPAPPSSAEGSAAPPPQQGTDLETRSTSRPAAHMAENVDNVSRTVPEPQTVRAPAATGAEAGQQRARTEVLPPGVETDDTGTARNIQGGEGGGSAINQNREGTTARVTGRDVSSPPESEQETELETEPTSAPANPARQQMEVASHLADEPQAANISITPAPPVGEGGGVQRTPDTGLDSSAAAPQRLTPTAGNAVQSGEAAQPQNITGNDVTDHRDASESEQETTLETQPASASVARPPEQADLASHLADEPQAANAPNPSTQSVRESGGVQRTPDTGLDSSAAAPERPTPAPADVSQTADAVRPGETATRQTQNVTGTDVSDRRDALLPPARTQAAPQTTGEDEADLPTTDHADAATHVVSESGARASNAPAGPPQTQTIPAGQGVDTTVTTPTSPVTPENEVTERAMEGSTDAAPQAAPPQTGETVSGPADAEGKTLADIIAESHAPTTQPVDTSSLHASDTETAEEEQQPQGTAEDLGLGAHQLRDHIVGEAVSSRPTNSPGMPVVPPLQPEAERLPPGQYAPLKKATPSRRKSRAPQPAKKRTAQRIQKARIKISTARASDSAGIRKTAPQTASAQPRRAAASDIRATAKRQSRPGNTTSPRRQERQQASKSQAARRRERVRMQRKQRSSAADTKPE